MQIQGSVALVTGANRGLGLAFVQALLARGARKVYAAAREPSSIKLPGVTPLRLDVRSDADVAAAIAAAPDVSLLINNAGVASVTPLLAQSAVDQARAEFEINAIGPLRVSRAFAPVLARNGGGAIVNVLSVASWINGGMLATYSVSKSAAWSVTNGLRGELRDQGTQVVALHVGFMDTDMASGINMPKIAPAKVATATLDGVEAGQLEVLADERSQQTKQGLSAPHGVYLGEPR